VARLLAFGDARTLGGRGEPARERDPRRVELLSELSVRFLVTGRELRVHRVGDVLLGGTPVEPVVEGAELALDVGVATQDAFEPVVAGEGHALEPVALEPGGAVLGAERVGGKAARIEPQPRGGVVQRGHLGAHQPVEVEDAHVVGAEHVEPPREELGVAAAAERHVLLVVGVLEVGRCEPVGDVEVLGDGVLGREAQPNLLIREERDRATHRFAQHDERVRVDQPRAQRLGDGRAAVEVRGRGLEAHRAVTGVGEVRVPLLGGRQALAVARREEEPRLLDRRRRDVGMRRQRHEQRGRARLVDPCDDRIGAAGRHGWRPPDRS